ncbi:MAG TPA: FAD-dependent oxidoreductase [Albitalea sp.]|uniref:flavin monoamine oxidase family protein n=1 Tax=Piscinibacter sp. TaxID=1903157 RepID=UPI002ECFD6E6
MAEPLGVHFHQTGLRTIGRPMPPLHPRSIGRYMTQPIGAWPLTRRQLPDAVIGNLQTLSGLAGDEHKAQREQLHLELTLHWHCLCEVEQRDVLETLGTTEASLLGHVSESAATDAPSTPVRDWLQHTTLFMKPQMADRLLRSCGEIARQALKEPFEAAADASLRAMLTERFRDLRMTLPLDHQYDFAGFMEETQRVYGKLPPDLQGKLKVCIVGGGPTGIVAADGLNRMGAVPTVMEQHFQIGGRVRTVRTNGKTGEMSPTPMEMGAMRFAPIRGNSYFRLAKHFGVDMLNFPNPDTVKTSYLIGNQVYEADKGEPSDPQMQRIKQEYIKAVVEPLLQPIRQARDAADTARFRELCDEALSRFDPHNFQEGLDVLLKDQGIEWTQSDWEIFGAIGIGVGGYKGYFTSGFLEEFRFLMDERLEDHVFFPGGADTPLHALVKNREPLPNGEHPTSLEEQAAVRTSTEVTSIKKKDGKYLVTSLDKHTLMSTVEAYDEVIFAAPPSEAIRLGITGPQEGSEPLVSSDLATAMEGTRLVPSTKLAVKVPKELFESVELPENVQSSKPFQQMYVQPPINGGNSYMVFMSYQLGDNAVKTASLGKDEQFDLFVSILKNAAAEHPGEANYEKLKRFGEVLEQCKDQAQFVAWGQEKHFGAAFKMDAPMQLSNTRTLWNSMLKKPDGLIVAHEMITAEGGFASGGVSAAVLACQAIVAKHGGELPAYSPFHYARA